MKKIARKLKLSKETLRNLETGEMAHAQGGDVQRTVSCLVTCGCPTWTCASLCNSGACC